MVVQLPPPRPSTPESEVDAGVIEDARRRQRLHRRVGASLLALVAAGALAAGLTAGGGGSGGGGSGGGAAAQLSGSGGGAASHGSANSTFPGAPVSQARGYGVETNLCPLAPPNRYLPARSGCVSVRRADLNGDGRADLIIVYSTLSRERPTSSMGESVPKALRGEFAARAAFLKVVQAGGPAVSVRIPQPPITHVAAIDFLTRIGTADELFLRVAQFAGGATDLAYGSRDGRLVPAGVSLTIGADGGSRMGYSCLPGNPPRLIERIAVLLGPNIHGWWKETRIAYVWRAGRLVMSSRSSFRHHGYLPDNTAALTSGCTRVG